MTNSEPMNMTTKAITFHLCFSRFSSNFDSLDSSLTLGTTVPFLRREGIVLSPSTDSLSLVIIFREFESLSCRDSPYHGIVFLSPVHDEFITCLSSQHNACLAHYLHALCTQIARVKKNSRECANALFDPLPDQLNEC